ncbi:MAG: hypothetical protein KJ041_06050 [Gammaproteobacteria bacterium]|nr:hypothetical protein [Gammaproteobacteria bacterium]
MLERLTGAHRLWMMFSGALLASAITVLVLIWPGRDPAVTADLASPVCQALHDRPLLGDERDPESDAPCRALRTLNEHDHATVRTSADYDSLLTRKRARLAATGLLIWAAVAALVYLLGWLSGRTVQQIMRRRKRGGT